MSEYSDEKWLVSNQGKNLLLKDIRDAMDFKLTNINMQIGFRQKYTRKYPDDALTASHLFKYQLNFTNWNDCKARDDFLRLADLDCKKTPGAESSVVIR